MKEERICSGSEVDRCEICDKQITKSDPGWEWQRENNLYKYKVRVCNNCFSDPEYRSIVRRHFTQLKSYPQWI